MTGAAGVVLPPVSNALSWQIVTDQASAETTQTAWTDLLGRTARSEVVQTPEWLLTWWRVFGSQQRRELRLAQCYAGDRLIGMAPLVARRHWYRPGLPFRRLEFLGSGEPPAHAICSEYLNILAERGAEAAVASSFVDAAVAGSFGNWDEIVLSMMDGDGPMPAHLAAAFGRAGVAFQITTTGSAPYIPLPSSWDDYLAAQSKSNRTLIRDSVRRFEKWAGADGGMHHASSPADMEAFKQILIGLHRQRWGGKRQGGVFRSRVFLRFHDEVLPLLIRKGAVELSYLDGPGGEPIAAAYNLVWDGKISFYQSGRKIDLPNNIRPGIVLHAYSIRTAIQAGKREYDFLGGPERYKRQLALASRPLVQLRAYHSTAVEALHRAFEWTMDHTRSLRRFLRSKGDTPVQGQDRH